MSQPGAEEQRGSPGRELIARSVVRLHPGLLLVSSRLPVHRGSTLDPRDNKPQLEDQPPMHPPTDWRQAHRPVSVSLSVRG